MKNLIGNIIEHKSVKLPIIKAHTILLVLFSITLSSCTIGNHASKQHLLSHNQKFGWLDGKCLAIKNDNLEPGTDITIVTLTEPQHHLKGTIIKGEVDSSNCGAFAPGLRMANIAEYRFYRVLVEAPVAIAIGVVQRGNDTTKLFKFSYAACTTSEGIRFTVWRGDPHESPQLWSGYEYLGYDMQGTCVETHAQTKM